MISQTFEFTGAFQSWTVPAGVNKITVELWGGQGRSRGGQPAAPAGGGGYVKADVNVTPGTTYRVYVGQWGADWTTGTQVRAFGGALGGLGGDQLSPTAWKGGGGGGSSEFRNSDGSQRILVAGGGGGGSHEGVTHGDILVEGGDGGGTAHGMDGNTIYFHPNRTDVTPTHGQGGRTATVSANGVGGAGGGTAYSGSPTGSAGQAGTATQGGNGGNGGTGTYHMGSGGGGGGFFSGGGGGGGVGSAPFPSTLAQPAEWGIGGGGGGGSSYAGHTSVVAGSITLTGGVRAGNGRVVISYLEPPPSIPTNITPAAGAVINVSNPTLTAVFTVSATQAMAKVEWTLANDAGFTQNVRVYTQPDSALQRASLSSASYQIGSLASDQLLSQGTWYIRARTIDQNGTDSAFSGTHSFRVEYPPTTINHFPTGNVAVAHIPAGNVFAWDFISPSPFTDQIAYQVVVETNAGVQIADTGRVDTTQEQTTVIIPAARKGEQLRWRVRVWDSDNIQGPYSSYQLFRVVDGPTVTIDNMTTIETANPTVSFQATPAVNTTITQKRLYITRDSDGAIVYDSGWVS